MTGYGRSEGRHQSHRVVVELRSVNHRYCEVMLRLPKLLLSIETEIKKLIQDRFSRGRIDCSISLNGEGRAVKKLILNRELAGQYCAVMETLKRDLGLEGGVDLSLLAAVPDLIEVKETPMLAEELGKTAKRLLKKAMDSLDQMRRWEGKQLYHDLTARIKALRQALKTVDSRAPRVLKAYQRRLVERVKGLSQGLKLDRDRVHQEVALFAEKCDVTEEITRLQSHTKQFEQLISKGEEAGRRLDFLIQEMNREVNTIGSKGNDVVIAREVVRMKAELEKLREQVQNIE
jgi:uncharacterized protein (TIGR00255 family)